MVLDRGTIVNSIVHFPLDMTFFTTSDLLELHGIPFNSRAIKPDRREAIRYYQNLVNYFGIPVTTGADVLAIQGTLEWFDITFRKEAAEQVLQARKIIIASGFFDQPNLLNVPGEKLPHVSHYYREPFAHFHEKVAVVGGKNSAVEAALELHRHGAEVTLIHRKSEIRESVKYWVLPDIKNRIAEGKIQVRLKTTVEKIRRGWIEINQDGRKEKLAADAVYLLTGYHPDVSLLENSGIRYDADTLEPEIDPHTLESSVSGIYLAGSLIAGRNSNRIFIENSRDHGEKILSDVENKL